MGDREEKDVLACLVSLDELEWMLQVGGYIQVTRWAMGGVLLWARRSFRVSQGNQEC